MESYTLFNQQYSITAKSIEELQNDQITVDDYVQRDLKKSRIKQLTNYIKTAILNNQTAFFPPLILSKAEDNRIIILDGQHRWNALSTLFEETPDENIKNHLKSYKIPVIILETTAPEQQRQIFHDVNYYAKKVDRSIAIDFNSRDDLHRLLHQILEKNQKLNELTYNGRGKRESSQIIKLAYLYDALVGLVFGSLKVRVRPKNGKKLETIAYRFFDILAKHVLQPSDKKSIYNKRVVIRAIARYASDLIVQREDWDAVLIQTLKNVDLDNLDDETLSSVNFLRDETGNIKFTGTEAGVSGFIRILQNAQPQ
ncbi:DGQHR domain-containing protein [Alicyclobacillus tolerans]|uniref:DGQHR domain-containing protein n=1 Tax=Alicyclobacillus tolerans TaxID=90970 RepID=UPI001F20D2E3|nr:DGQHR domain-containing protein [Alicyclobacillus tolerans]MCF8566988.1 DGQHR domain-containing protein [Alicyclobacillus tolerans]